MIDAAEPIFEKSRLELKGSTNVDSQETSRIGCRGEELLAYVSYAED